MEKYLDFRALTQSLRHVVDSVAGMLLDVWLVVQAGLLVVSFVVAWYAAGYIRPYLQRRIAGLSLPGGMERPIAAVPGLLSLILFLALLWLVIGILHELTWPSRSYGLRVVASLMTAWIFIKLLSTFVRNTALAKSLALIVWIIAALNITGLLGATVEALNSLSMTFGEVRISLLTVLKGVVSATVLIWAAAVLSRLFDARIQHSPDLSPSIQVLLGKLLKITLLAVAIVIALKSVGIDLTALALFSGAIGLGIGFGLQKVVSNVISGVILLLDKSIKPGDVIELGETFGWISSLGARYVSVVTRDGKEYLIPNEDLITQRVVNWSFSSQLVRVEVPIGVSYHSDPHEVRRLLADAAAGPERVMGDPAPVCHLVGFGDSSLNFLLRFWIRDPEKGVVNVKGEVLLAVWDALKKAGIQIPYPHRQLLFSDPLRADGTAP